MAIYHLEAKIISRGAGRSAVAASAYMSCSRLCNDYDGIEHDYTKKYGLVHQEVMLPPQAPPEWADREKPWNAVETAEKTKDSRLAREFVAALPVELTSKEWIELLRQYIRDNFVAEGMCADFSIHDTDGHNPHAHILLTVRPLDGNGGWQYKSEKEYICIRDGEERGFTADEYKKAQPDGWEKQYQYKVGRRKMYMAPSKADDLALERISKYPKSTRYGRQNLIAERWNSEGQLVRWREAWADSTNRVLKEKEIEAQIDHRSFRERGITEQPTIHEGVSARIMEQQGILSERRELNRRIRADNRLLRRLKSELQKLSDTVKNSVPKIAQAMETLFANLIISRYHLKQERKSVDKCREWLDRIKPDDERYQAVRREIDAKTSLCRDLQAEQKAASVFNISRRISLSKEITTLTEDIEELKNQLAGVYFYYQSEEDFKAYCAEIPAWKKSREKHEESCRLLENRIQKQTEEFLSLKANVSPDQVAELARERDGIHPETINQALEHLKTCYKGKFDYQQFKTAKTETADSLYEAEREFSIHQRLEQAQAEKSSQAHNERTAAKHNTHSL